MTAPARSVRLVASVALTLGAVIVSLSVADISG
jgi:hypothetical protein